MEPALYSLFEKNPKGGFLLLLILMTAVIAIFVQSCSSSKTATSNEDTSYDDAKNEKIRLSANAKVDAETNLKATLKDADSAEFRNETVYRLPGGNLILCGEVNSRNSFGGYSGFKRFIASPNPEAPTVVDGETILGRKASKGTFNKAFAKACSDSYYSFN